MYKEFFVSILLFFAKLEQLIKKESLVDVSPSTVIRLKVLSTTSCIRQFNIFLLMFASKKMNPNMVAIFGLIIPEPFAIPVHDISCLLKKNFWLIALGIVSVVIIASAASIQ